jgi:hypothetical protein
VGNMLNEGREWLTEQLTANASVVVEYVRGESAIELLLATVGRSIFDEEDARGNLITVETRDYLVKTDNLIIDAIQSFPMEGDLIIETQADRAYTYRVLPVGAEPCYRFVDAGRFMLRIHTKLVSEGPA